MSKYKIAKMRQLKPEELLVLAAATLYPTNEETAYMDELILKVSDWSYAEKIAIERGIGPLLYKKIQLFQNQNYIPSSTIEALKQSYLLTLSRNIFIYNTFNDIVLELKKNNIEIFALKGIYLAEHIYKDIGIRQLSDIDILVSEEYSKLAFNALLNLGFKKVESGVSEFIAANSDIVHLPQLVRNGVSVEIHIKLHYKNENCNIDLAGFKERASLVSINSVESFIFDIYDLIIHICVHLNKHFIAREISFTTFCDLNNLVRINFDKLDWNLFLERCKDSYSLETVLKYLYLSNKFFNTPLPEIIKNMFQFNLSSKDNDLFLNYLEGKKYQSLKAGVHISNISLTKNPLHKLRYFVEVVFPSKQFMLRAYPIKSKNFFWLWYPYRHYIGFKGVLKKLFNF